MSQFLVPRRQDRVPLDEKRRRFAQRPTAQSARHSQGATTSVTSSWLFRRRRFSTVASKSSPTSTDTSLARPATGLPTAQGHISDSCAPGGAYPERMKRASSRRPYGHDVRQAVPHGKPSVMAPEQAFSS
jgi:hypothetical protein